MTEYDAFDDKPQGGGFLGSIGPKVALFIVLVTLAFLVGVVWNLYSNSGNNDGSIQVPIVRADAQPTKVIPDDRGGMEIAHRDSTIFSTLSGDKVEKKVENLLADDTNEEPLPRSQLFAGLNTESENKNYVAPEVADNLSKVEEEIDLTPQQPAAAGRERVTQKVTGSISPAVIEDEKVVQKIEQVQEVVKEAEVKSVVEEEPKPVAKPVVADTKPEPKPVAKPVVKEPVPKPVAQAQPVKATSGDYVVQLASIKDKARADSEWKKLSSKYSSALSGVPYRVEMAVLGERGTFYRIQAGPVTKDKANAICSQIKAVNPNGCIVKKK